MNRIAYAIPVVCVLLAACAGSPTQVPAADGNMPVTLRFAAQVAGQPFECGKSYTGIGRTASTITPSDFRMYVSEVHLIEASGRAVPVTLAQDGIWQFENIDAATTGRPALTAPPAADGAEAPRASPCTSAARCAPRRAGPSRRALARTRTG